MTIPTCFSNEHARKFSSDACKFFYLPPVPSESARGGGGGGIDGYENIFKNGSQCKFLRVNLDFAWEKDFLSQ